MFDDTVFNNIRYGSPHATATRSSRPPSKPMPTGSSSRNSNTAMTRSSGAGGGRLSGGQRQRIALARAMLRDPAILILDEATSQIDIESEQLIHKVLEQFVRDRTAILITHRLATLDLADRILVMQAGRVHDFRHARRTNGSLRAVPADVSDSVSRVG